MATTDPLVLADSAEVEFKRVENIHQTRFAEFFLVYRQPESGSMAAEVYNTMYTTEGIPESKDTAPEERFDRLTRLVTREGQEIELQPKEFALLEQVKDRRQQAVRKWWIDEGDIERLIRRALQPT